MGWITTKLITVPTDTKPSGFVLADPGLLSPVWLADTWTAINYRYSDDIHDYPPVYRTDAFCGITASDPRRLAINQKIMMLHPLVVWLIGPTGWKVNPKAMRDPLVIKAIMACKATKSYKPCVTYPN